MPWGDGRRVTPGAQPAVSPSPSDKPRARLVDHFSLILRRAAQSRTNVGSTQDALNFGAGEAEHELDERRQTAFLALGQFLAFQEPLRLEKCPHKCCFSV